MHSNQFICVQNIQTGKKWTEGQTNGQVENIRLHLVGDIKRRKQRGWPQQL